MTRNFIYIQFALWSSESDITELILLEVRPERVTTMEELGRGAFGRVYKSVMRGLPEKDTSSKPRDHSLDSHEGRIVATKVLPGAWIQNMPKRWLTLSTDVSMLNWFTGMTLNRLELFNPIGSKYYIVENSISIPQSVTGRCTWGVHFRPFVFSYVYQWPPRVFAIYQTKDVRL